MHAVVGDRLHVHGNVVGHADRTGLIVEVRAEGGEPPYTVRFDDGHTCLVFPGPDAVVEHPEKPRTSTARARS
jgi:archaeosine-15-forming tRNA-guanine transglycosylase